MATTTLSDLLSNITVTAQQAAADGAAKAAALDEFVLHSSATEPTEGFVLPVAPAVKAPRGFQTAAVETVLKFRRALLGFAPGMGKTLPSACVVAALAEEGERSVVIVPAPLRTQWAREFAAEFPSLRVEILAGQKSAPLPSAEVVILSSAILSHRADDIIEWAPTGVVFDEAQQYKNIRAKRTKALHKLVDALSEPVVLGLTGTLVMNRAPEVFGPVRALGTEAARALSGTPTWSGFKNRWCEVQMFMGNAVAVGLREDVSAEEMHNRLVETSYVHVRREDVLDMPAKVVTGVSLEVSGEAMRTYARMEADFISWVADTKGVPAALRAAKAEAITRMNALRMEAGRVKVKASADYIANLVEQGEQVVVMVEHADVVDGLVRELTGRPTGGVNSDGTLDKMIVREFHGRNIKVRDQHEIDFNDGLADVIVVNIQAGGQGLNLAAAKHLVFVQLPWGPGQFTQCSDRVYRANSKEIHGDANITIHSLALFNSIDEHMWAVLESKAAESDAVNRGEVGDTLGDATMTDMVLAAYGG